MSIIRVQKRREHPYVIMETTALNDEHLSFRARGLHAYLMSKPDSWEVNIRHLEAQSKRDGRHAIRATLQELEREGYIHRQRQRNEKGQLVGWVTVVYESPRLRALDQEDRTLDEPTCEIHTSVPKSEIPTSENPMSENPKSDNRTLVINDSSHYGEKQEKTIDPSTCASPATSAWRARFDEFWQAYPKKKAKGTALKTWAALKPSPHLIDTILTAIAAQAKSPDWQRDSGQYIPFPATWLSQQRWEDEVSREVINGVDMEEYRRLNRERDEQEEREAQERRARGE
jgi:hypothetical protein